jgi:uncharacterized protein with PIN domain
MSAVTKQEESQDLAKQRERSETEALRAVIKNQRSQIKNLKKEVDRAKKRSHNYEDFEERLAETMIEEEYKESKLVDSTERCPECDEKVEIVQLGTRIGIFCECGYRRTKKV